MVIRAALLPSSQPLKRARPGWGHLALGAFGLLSMLPIPVLAQSTPTPPAPAQQANPAQARRYTAAFEANILKGCLKNATNLPNAQTACQCYAKAFTKRYSARDLTVIDSFASRSEGALQLISVLLAPERRACLLTDK